MTLAPSNPLRVALYARVSTEEQREGQTIDSQVDALHRLASQRGFLVVDVYKDEGWSGSMLARPALDQLRDAASRNAFEGVLIHDVDRLARDVTHLGILKRDLERHHVQVIFGKLPSDASPAHNLLVNILGSFAEFEREIIADRTRRGRRHKVEARQQYLGARAPYGYHYTTIPDTRDRAGRLEVVPEEANVVREMYRWVDEEGLSAGRVRARLNHLRIPTPHGGAAWQGSSVHRILRNETYSGTWHYNKHKSCEPLRSRAPGRYHRSAHTSRRLRSRTDWIPVRLPTPLCIVEPDRWRRVQTQIDHNQTFSPRHSKHSYLLTGLLRCGACSAAYVGDPVHGRYFYRCSRRCKRLPTIKEGVLNAAVWDTVCDAFSHPTIIERQLSVTAEKSRLQADQARAEMSEIIAALARLDTEQSRLVEAYQKEILSAEILRAELAKLTARRLPLEGKRADLEGSVTAQGAQPSMSQLTDYVRLVAQRLGALDPDERRRLLRVVLTSVIFEGERVRIRARFLAPHDLPRPPAATPSSPLTEASPDLSSTIAARIVFPTIGHDGGNAAEVGRVEDILPRDGPKPFEFELTATIDRPTPAAQHRDQLGRFVS